MTRGRNILKGDESIYDQRPILLFDSFAWTERAQVLQALRSILDGRALQWRFSGAYVFAALEREGAGDLLYCGEAVDLGSRIGQHFRGGSEGNQFENLNSYFSALAERECCVGLLVLHPEDLPWFCPPDDGPFLEDGTQKRAAEALEALLLRAAINLRGERLVFNEREDEARAAHDSDAVRLQSLLRFLLDHPDASRDFVSYKIRSEQMEARAHLVGIVKASPHREQIG